MKISLLVAHHKAGPYLKTDVIKPIHVGAALGQPIGFDGDNTQNNISEKNKNYCELTAQYWMWKNQINDYDYFGLMHYRRYFVFSKNFEFNKNIIDDFDQETLSGFGLDDSTIKNTILDNDIILPPKWPVHPANLRSQLMTVYDFYARDHIQSDMDTAIEVIKDLYPEYVTSLNNVMNSKESYFLNMFIMNKKYFNEYMEWIFNILFEVEKRIEISNDPYQARVFGFLSERLINVYLDHIIQRDNPKIKELQIAFCRFEPHLKSKNKASFLKRTFRKLKSIKRVN